MLNMPPKKRKENEESSEQVQKKSRPENTEVDQAATTDALNEEAQLKDETEKIPQSGTCGMLLISGGTNWDLIGRKEAPKNSGSSGGPNLWEPHLMSSLKGVRIRHIASGPSACHSIIVTEDGTAMSFGRNDKGQLGHNNTEQCGIPKVIESLKNHTVVQASCGKNHSLVLTDKGLVFGFGENKMAQLGQGHQKPVITKPVQVVHPENRKIKKVACGAEFSMFIDEKHMLYSFGSPEHGQLGHNTDGQYFVSANKLGFDCEVLPRHVAVFVEKHKDGFVNVLTDVRIVDVSCGNNHTIARDDKERVFTCGFGGYGRLGHQQPKDEHVPRLLTYFNHRGASTIFAGSTYTMALSMTQLFFWGQTKSAGEATMYPKPVQDLSGWDVRSVGCSKTSIVVAADDSVVSWGPSPTYGELGYGLKKGGQKSSTNPKIVNPLEGVYIHAVTCGYGHTLFIARDDQEGDKEKLAKLPVFDPASL